MGVRHNFILQKYLGLLPNPEVWAEYPPPTASLEMRYSTIYIYLGRAGVRYVYVHNATDVYTLTCVTYYVSAVPR
jgi:hypothetical protein